MSILILGSGGREHALAWKIAQSPIVENVYIAPGNAGSAQVGENVLLNLTNHQEVIDFCREAEISLVVIGPDDLLAAGMADSLRGAGILTFGASKDAAEIEWSKAYAKALMQEAGIPTAKSQTFMDYDSARAYVDTQQLPLVVKASGLALGKGVTIAQTKEEAEQALRDCFVDAKFGTAGSQVVIEEYMEGFEFSVHAICAGTDALLFPSSQDHKRIFDGDQGPNTGGMGVVAPLPNISPAVMEEIRVKVVLPTLRTLKKRGRPFNGLLYPGIMLTKEGPKVIEFNARFGDPEAQVYLRLMESDIVPVLKASAEGDLSGASIRWKKESAVCVVLASGGYPGSYEKGKEITGVEDSGEVVVFHAGTKREGEKLLTNGGRVLNVTATGSDLKEALAHAYQATEKISFEGVQYRKDIGAKASN